MGSTILWIFLILGIGMNIAASIANWGWLDTPNEDYIIIPLWGFSLAALIIGAISSVVIAIAGTSVEMGSDDSSRRLGLGLLVGGALCIIAVALFEWPIIWNNLAIPMNVWLSVPILGSIVGILGSIIIAAAATTIETEAQKQRDLEIARKQRSAERRTAARIKVLEHDLAQLRGKIDDPLSGDAGDEADDGDLANQRSKEIAEMIRRANQD